MGRVSKDAVQGQDVRDATLTPVLAKAAILD